MDVATRGGCRGHRRRHRCGAVAACEARRNPAGLPRSAPLADGQLCCLARCRYLCPARPVTAARHGRSRSPACRHALCEPAAALLAAAPARHARPRETAPPSRSVSTAAVAGRPRAGCRRGLAYHHRVTQAARPAR